MSVLDPVALDKLAAYMRDETWLDIRICDHGPVERVQIMNITVWPDHEDVTMRQEVMRGEDIHELQLEADAEDIMWARPTAFPEPLDVQEAKPVEPPREEEFMPGRLEEAYDATLDAVAFAHSMSRAELDKELNEEFYSKYGKAVHRRYEIIWILRQVMDDRLSTLEICQRIGYKSVMPMQCARQRFEGFERAQWEGSLTTLEAIVRARL